jgi:hypothetical protein
MTTSICTECTGTNYGHYYDCSQYGGDKRHVHHKEIHAYAEGEVIEHFDEIEKEWFHVDNPQFYPKEKYRIKQNLEKTLDSLLEELIISVENSILRGAGATIVDMKLQAIKAFFKENTK